MISEINFSIPDLSIYPLRKYKIIIFQECIIKYYESIYNNLDKKIKFLTIFSKKAFIQSLAIKIEEACYKHTNEKCKSENIFIDWTNKEYTDIYNLICYKISSNIEINNDVNNVELIKSIVEEKVDISTLPKKTSQELFMSKYDEIYKLIENSKNIETSVKYSIMYTCRKCKESKTTIISVQNRSLDEGNSIEITCINCGFKWFN